MYSRATYVLTDGTTRLLTLPAEDVACPYAVGQQITLVPPEAMGAPCPYVVTAIHRQQPFTWRPTTPPSRAPLAGEEIVVQLRPLAPAPRGVQGRIKLPPHQETP